MTIIERSRPASGVTARSFAWINVVRGNAPAIARLRNSAIADYRRLERELDGALVIDWNGALTWSTNPSESERLVTEHTASGHDVRLVGRDEIRRLEPRLAAPPPVAAHAAGEGTLDPVAATLTLVRAAVEAGAQLVEGSEVQGLATTDGRVCGVVLPSGTVEADTVVLAAGTSSKAICAGIGVELPVASSPATLTRFAGPRGLVGRVVAGPDLEIRQDAAGRLFVSDYYVEGESPEDRAAITLALIRRRFHGADTVTPVDARVGWRPIPADGVPIVGFTPDAPGPLSRRHARGCGDGPRRGPARHRRDRGRQRGRGIGALPRVPLRIASRPWSQGHPVVADVRRTEGIEHVRTRGFREFPRGRPNRDVLRPSPVDSGTPTDRGMNSYTGPPRIRYRAVNSGVTLIRMHRFLRLVAVGLLEGYCRFLPHSN